MRGQPDLEVEQKAELGQVKRQGPLSSAAPLGPCSAEDGLEPIGFREFLDKTRSQLRSGDPAPQMGNKEIEAFLDALRTKIRQSRV